MTVIFTGGDFLILFKTVIKNKFFAGNIPVIKRSLFRVGRGGGGGGGEGEERMEESSRA